MTIDYIKTAKYIQFIEGNLHPASTNGRMQISCQPTFGITLQFSHPSNNSFIVSLAVRPQLLLPPVGIIPAIWAYVVIAGHPAFSGVTLRLDSGLLISRPESISRTYQIRSKQILLSKNYY